VIFEWERFFCSQYLFFFFLWVKLSIFYLLVQKFGLLRNNLKPYFLNTVWTLRRVDLFFWFFWCFFLYCWLSRHQSICCSEVVILENNLKIMIKKCGKVQTLAFLLLNRTFLNWIIFIQLSDSQNRCELFHEKNSFIDNLANSVQIWFQNIIWPLDIYFCDSTVDIQSWYAILLREFLYAKIILFFLLFVLFREKSYRWNIYISVKNFIVMACQKIIWKTTKKC